MKYINTKIVFQEVPDRITLAINISGCPIHCPECHSKWLWEDAGIELNEEELNWLIIQNTGINCVAFMGGDAETSKIKAYSAFIKERYPKIQTCWYSGRRPSEIHVLGEDGILDYLDYVKLGPYQAEKGGLDAETTNQRMYLLEHQKDGVIVSKDITAKFRRKYE